MKNRDLSLPERVNVSGSRSYLHAYVPSRTLVLEVERARNGRGLRWLVKFFRKTLLSKKYIAELLSEVVEGACISYLAEHLYKNPGKVSVLVLLPDFGGLAQKVAQNIPLKEKNKRKYFAQKLLLEVCCRLKDGTELLIDGGSVEYSREWGGLIICKHRLL